MSSSHWISAAFGSCRILRPLVLNGRVNLLNMLSKFMRVPLDQPQEQAPSFCSPMIKLARALKSPFVDSGGAFTYLGR